MSFESILFDARHLEMQTQPVCFPDLCLDQVVEAFTAGRKGYDLKPFFWTPLQDVDLIRYRHEVMRDLESGSLLAEVKSFAQSMTMVRRYLAMAEKFEFPLHREGWFLQAALEYCQAVAVLSAALSQADVQSRGFLALRAYLQAYASGHHFNELVSQALKLDDELASVKYCINIRGSTVKVRRYGAESDYSTEVEQTFAKFKQGAVKDYRLTLYARGGMNHVEARILELVARLYPTIFAELKLFCTDQASLVDDLLRRFDQEIQFYVAYQDHIAPMKRAGLSFCYPEIAVLDKDVYSEQAFDIALASRLAWEGAPVVPNDFFLQDAERVVIVSGPNQGGKTTFARTFGQLHYLASLGLPVPGLRARLILPDRIFTHFEKEEDIRNLRGKLQDDLVRIRAILGQASPGSLLILNEIFSSTTLQDAVFLSTKLMARIADLDMLCVWVTFIDELASYSNKTISMVSTVNPDNPVERTFKIVRKPADGLAYALSLAERHGLTRTRIEERIQP
jgi:DNA mismatch repair ATPase MutS